MRQQLRSIAEREQVKAPMIASSNKIEEGSDRQHNQESKIFLKRR